MGTSPDVLLVDDNDFVADCLQHILALAGYTVLRAETADEGWVLFQQHSPRAVVTDNAMVGDRISDLSGLDLAIRIKRAAPCTPVIMLSALPPPQAVAVCDRVLGKPVATKLLMGALRDLDVLPAGA